MAKRILVVEDDEKSRRLLQDVLSYHGYEVLAAETGEQGLQLAAPSPPHAALVDIQLPGVSGFLVLEGLRAMRPSMAILAVTASVMDHDRKRILEAGFDAYVAKPVNIRQILDLLKDRVERVFP